MDPLDLEKEESLDLGKLWQVTKENKKVVGGIIAFGYSLVMYKREA